LGWHYGLKWVSFRLASTPIDATLKSINDRFDLFEHRLTFNLGVVMVASVVFWSAVFKLL
jgi:hypothetical protein